MTLTNVKFRRLDSKKTIISKIVLIAGHRGRKCLRNSGVMFYPLKQLDIYRDGEDTFGRFVGVLERKQRGKDADLVYAEVDFRFGHDFVALFALDEPRLKILDLRDVDEVDMLRNAQFYSKRKLRKEQQLLDDAWAEIGRWEDWLDEHYPTLGCILGALNERDENIVRFRLGLIESRIVASYMSDELGRNVGVNEAVPVEEIAKVYGMTPDEVVQKYEETLEKLPVESQEQLRRLEKNIRH